MAKIRVNGSVITAADLCMEECDVENLIECWVIHEIEDVCESDEIEKRLSNTIMEFAKTPECTTLTFEAVLDGDFQKVTIEKIG